MGTSNKLSDIAWSEIQCKARVRSDRTGIEGTIRKKVVEINQEGFIVTRDNEENPPDLDKAFVIIDWDNGQSSNQPALWLKEVTYLGLQVCTVEG